MKFALSDLESLSGGVNGSVESQLAAASGADHTRHEDCLVEAGGAEETQGGMGDVLEVPLTG